MLAVYWKNPADPTPLRVWADLLTASGDPRSEFIALSLTDDLSPAQDKRHEALRRSGGQLVGPTRDFLRKWAFGQRFGRARDLRGPEVGRRLRAHRELEPAAGSQVTSVAKRAKQTLAALAKLPLCRFPVLWLEANSLTDEALATLAPSLVGVKELSLGQNEVTAEGLGVLKQLKGFKGSTSINRAWLDDWSLCSPPSGSSVINGWALTLRG